MKKSYSVSYDCVTVLVLLCVLCASFKGLNSFYVLLAQSQITFTLPNNSGRTSFSFDIQNVLNEAKPKGLM